MTAYYLTCLIVLFPTLAASTAPHAIIASLQNVSRPVNSTATFHCDAKFGTEPVVLDWIFNYETIVYSRVGDKEEYPEGNEKYFVSQTTGGLFRLEIRNLDFADGGIYSCRTPNFEVFAALIVMAWPILTSKVEKPIEGEKATYICEGFFGGPNRSDINPDQFPQMGMIHAGVLIPGFIHEEDPENGTEYYYLRREHLPMTLQIRMDGEEVRCQFRTLNIQPGLSMSATSIIEVKYVVRDLQFSPIRDKYEIGEIINCTALGNPTPSYVWEDMNNEGKVIRQQSLTIEEYMVGHNSWKCTASNKVNGSTVEVHDIVEFEVCESQCSNGHMLSPMHVVTLACSLFFLVVMFSRNSERVC